MDAKEDVKHDHRFQHTTIDLGTGFRSPLWIVGGSPFESIKTEQDGYVVHLGEPRFIARWFLGEEPSNPDIDTLGGLTYCNPDLDITLCELVLDSESPNNLKNWLFEACAAVAVWRGDLTISAPAEESALRSFKQ